MLNYLFIGLGSALGGMARYWLAGVVAQRWGDPFPTGTLLVNVTGSFAIGFFAAFAKGEGGWAGGPLARNFFMSGLCGGYTTFSSFSLQTLNLVREGAWFYAGLNVVLSVVLCLLGVWLGYLSAQWGKR